MDYKLLGANVRKIRKQKGYTILQLSEMISVSDSFLGQLERGVNKPSLETLLRISNILGASMDSLIFNNLNKESSKSYFLSEVDKQTKDLTTTQKTIILENIELLKRFLKNQ